MSRRTHTVWLVLALVVGCLAWTVAATAGNGNGKGKGNGNNNGGGQTGSSTTGSQDRQVLTGTAPPWASSAKQVGSVSGDAQETAKVWLAPRDSDALTALAKAVSDPSSSQYRQFLSHSEYVSQFAPTDAQVSAVEDWLTNAGLDIGEVGPDNHFVAVSGTASAVESAFGTTLGLFDSQNGTVPAPVSDLSAPTSVAGTVLAVTGLTPVGHVVERGDLGAPAGFVNATPCSSSWGDQKVKDLPKFQNKRLAYAPCGYVPSQLRGAYGVDKSGLDGSGVTVAITDAFDASTLESDANEYATRHGDQAFESGQFSDRSVPEDTSLADACGGNGWYGEQTLDIEAVHGMATGANVAYYGAASCFDDDLLAALAQVVKDDDASIVTNSWGEPTVIGDPDICKPQPAPCLTINQALVNAYESVFIQGAVQGIGFYFSSGDSGDEQQAWGYAHPDWPTGDPWVTSVGGTSLGIGNGNRRVFETGWGTSKWSLTSDGSAWTQTVPFQYGAGGGYSQIFEQPFYQDGIVQNNPTGGRAVPDIAMDADPTTGMLIGETQDYALDSVFGPAGVQYGEFRIGGTSLASPLMAGAQAVAQQGAGQRIGFANPLIYALKSQSNGNSTFYDVRSHQPDPGAVRADYVNGYNADDGVVYSVRTFDQDSSLTTGKAWDDVTGVGTVTGRYISRVAGK